MTRSILTLTMVASLLLGQSVAVAARAHAGLLLAGHDPRPHVHIDGEGSESDNGHDEPEFPEDGTGVLVELVDALPTGPTTVADESPLPVVIGFESVTVSNALERPAHRRERLRPPDDPFPTNLRQISLQI